MVMGSVAKGLVQTLYQGLRQQAAHESTCIGPQVAHHYLELAGFEMRLHLALNCRVQACLHQFVDSGLEVGFHLLPYCLF
jgi:hypothetical protein